MVYQKRPPQVRYKFLEQTNDGFGGAASNNRPGSVANKYGGYASRLEVPMFAGDRSGMGEHNLRAQQQLKQQQRRQPAMAMFQKDPFGKVTCKSPMPERRPPGFFQQQHLYSLDYMQRHSIGASQPAYCYHSQPVTVYSHPPRQQQYQLPPIPPLQPQRTLPSRAVLPPMSPYLTPSQRLPSAKEMFREEMAMQKPPCLLRRPSRTFPIDEQETENEIASILFGFRSIQ